MVASQSSEPDAATLSRADFLDALKTAHTELRKKLPRLAKLEGAREVLIYTYGACGENLARQLRASNVRCILYDNSEAARDRAAADGFDVTRDLTLDLPLIVAAGQNQIEILGELDREAFSLAEALYALDLHSSYGPARAFCESVVTDADRLFAIYQRIDASFRPAFLDMLLYRASLDVHRMVHRRPVGEMWRPPISGLDIRSFCDIGAYDGDSLAATKAAFPALSHSVTIEPNPAMAATIAAVAERAGIENRNFTGVAWSRPTRLGARTLLNGMLVIEEDNAGDIRAERLDTLAAGTAFDYVKMDVEGSEAEAMTGGVETLKRARCIAVASYHVAGDLVALPTLLSRLLGDETGMMWHLAFAHYSQSFEDSIFYLYR